MNLRIVEKRDDGIVVRGAKTMICGVAAANEIFGVSDTAAEAAREIVTAWKQARARGEGITVLNGRLIEQLHVDEAERTLKIHTAIQDIQAGE